jgi:hypothetical protein
VAAEADLLQQGEPRGFPGGRVVTLATLAVIAVAIAEVLVRDTIALWTAVALVTVSGIAALVTRAGDRSLPAMMPPLAFLAAALVAGQLLVADESGSLRRREVLMLADVLGSNATWVVAATVLSTTIALVRHLIDR